MAGLVAAHATPIHRQQSSFRPRCHDSRMPLGSLEMFFLKASNASLSCGKQLARAAASIVTLELPRSLHATPATSSRLRPR
ncbi:unnamed protein product [Urochloa humidicola]